MDNLAAETGGQTRQRYTIFKTSSTVQSSTLFLMLTSHWRKWAYYLCGDNNIVSMIGEISITILLFLFHSNPLSSYKYTFLWHECHFLVHKCSAKPLCPSSAFVPVYWYVSSSAFYWQVCFTRNTYLLNLSVAVWPLCVCFINVIFILLNENRFNRNASLDSFMAMFVVSFVIQTWLQTILS